MLATLERSGTPCAANDSPRDLDLGLGPVVEPVHVVNRYTGEMVLRASYSLRFAGEVVEISRTGHEAFDRTSAPIHDPDLWRGAPAPVRGPVREFSPRSRRRLAKACAAIPWGSFPFLFVTLTYPGEFSSDGKAVKRNLEAFRMAWTRKYGLPLAVWKLEFQRRGAPHFHLALSAPMGVPLVEVRRWVGATWYGIVGSGDERHLRAGVQVDEMIRPPTAYFSSHGQHEWDDKEYQNTVPDEYEAVGRFWGFWNLAPDWSEKELTRSEFVQARRIMRAWARSNGYRVRRNGGRVQGLWLRTRRRPSMFLAADVLRAVEVCTT